jgi:hypothetical protein
MFQFIIGFVMNVQQIKKRAKLICEYSFRDSFYARTTSKFILEKLHLCSYRLKCSCCFWTSQNETKECRAVN